MIELFTRKPEAVILPEDAVISPLPIDENVSSLSAILLNDDGVLGKTKEAILKELHSLYG